MLALEHAIPSAGKNNEKIWDSLPDGTSWMHDLLQRLRFAEGAEVQSGSSASLDPEDTATRSPGAN